MKKLFCMLFFATFSFCMMGQTRVIKGYVVDKKTGNYLPGAEVTVKGGAESTTTDADGSFSLEVGLFAKSAIARYAGMVDKKMRIGNKDMVFRMKKEKGFWFLNFQGGLVVGPAESVPSKYDIYSDYSNVTGNIGLMGGYLSNWGFYAKLMLSPWDDENDWLPMGFAGVTKRILPWMHATLGLGVGLGLQYNDYYYSSSTYYSYPSDPSRNYTSSGYGWSDGRAYSEIQIMPEIGLIFKVSKHLTANIHYGIGICTVTSNSDTYSSSYTSTYSYSTPPYTSTYSSYSWWDESAGLNHNLTIGIGYAF